MELVFGGFKRSLRHNVFRLGNDFRHTSLACHLFQGASSADGGRGNDDQCCGVNDLEHDWQMEVDHLADVCHLKKFATNMFIMQPSSTR